MKTHVKKLIYTIALTILSHYWSVAQSQWVLQEYLRRTGKNANEYLGAVVRGIGDFNNDGKPDVAVSDYGNTGIWYITANTDTVPKRIFVGANLTRGDINGDGYSDIIVVKGQQGGVGLDTVFIHFGTASGIDSIADVILVGEYGENGGDGFGGAIAVGDLNNDGINDLVISASHYPHGYSQGKVYIYLGRNQFRTNPDFTITGDTLFVNLGTICKIGDVNSDGISDLVVTGADERHSGQINEWYDYLNVYFGGPTFDTVKDFALKGIPGRSLFGGMAIMDANGDGKKDILWSSFDTREGIFIYFGKQTFDTIPNIILRPPSFFDLQFSKIIDAGDMDGDGFHDIALSDPYAFQDGGFVLIYRGGAALDTVWDAGKGRSDASMFGASMDTVGDVNGDGLSDIIIGAPEYAFFTNQGYFGIFLGDRRITAVEEKANGILPEIARLEQNYPNPFNPRTEVRFEVRGSSFVTLKVFNVLGKDIVTLVNEKKPTGSYTVTWDGTSTESGIYFYQLTVFTSEGKFYTETKKMALIK